ncbi:MAG TPA: hypothetical protein VFA19_14545 [Gaiellaceae bacterium]|nr:hypothetical protein [Gaiellaceae bacterium]
MRPSPAMGARPTSVARTPFWRRRQFWRAALPAAAVVAALAAGIAAYNAVYGSNGQPQSKTGWGVTYPAPAPLESVRLDPAVRPLVRRFVATAVARKDLAAAYAISGPAIRQGETLAQFAAGSIPVVPYAIDATSSVTFLRVDESQPASARLEVFLATPDRAVNSPHTFFVDLIKRRGRWYVNGWTPRWTPPIPTLP